MSTPLSTPQSLEQKAARKQQLDALNDLCDQRLGRSHTPLFSEAGLSKSTVAALDSLEVKPAESKISHLYHMPAGMAQKLEQFDKSISDVPTPKAPKEILSMEERLISWHKSLGSPSHVVAAELKQLHEQEAMKEHSATQEMKFHAAGSFIVQQHSENGSIIVDGVASREGVWKGVYRSADLLRDNARWMKGKYVTLNHPSASTGGRASAALAVGQVIDSSYDPDGHKLKVKCELWSKKLPGEILEQINSKKIIDLSTGYLAAENPTKGVWNGHSYDAVETSLDFDHLALVPQGACSQRDGCGLGL